MTQEEKHALIAERLEGLKVWKIVWSPPYSTDLNLCARVEGKIREMGQSVGELYTDLLLDVLLPGTRHTHTLDYDYVDVNALRSAPPTARVDAMVQLIQTLKP
jgi:hypothetical protein